LNTAAVGNRIAAGEDAGMSRFPGPRIDVAVDHVEADSIDHSRASTDAVDRGAQQQRDPGFVYRLSIRWRMNSSCDATVHSG
jgi:hypothetical protein